MFIYIYVYTNTLYISNDILLYLCADRQNIIYIYMHVIYILYIYACYIYDIYIWCCTHCVFLVSTSSWQQNFDQVTAEQRCAGVAWCVK